MVVSFLAIGAMLLVPRGPMAQAAQEVPIPGMGATCAACHPEPASEWARTIHRRTVGAPQISEDRQGCAACHTGAEKHLEDPTIEENRPSLAGMSGDQIADMCLSCHRGGQQMLWNLSPHQTTEKACLTCHDPHGGVGTAMLKAPETQLCQQCHPTQVAETNLPFHHPIVEGKMTCSDCHNVHGEQRGTLSNASNGEMCFKCHAEKGGPFVYEHPPVTEDCTICHKPHGSQNDNLLVQEQPMLCLQCHAGHSDGHRSPLVGLDPSTPEGAANAEIGVRFFYDKCTSCHSHIHGTDLPSGTGNGTFMPGGPLPTAGDESTALFAASAMDQSLWGFSGIEFDRFDEDGSPNFVREYDGKNYDVPAPEIVVSRFGAADDFRLEMKDLARGDQDVSLRFGNSLYDVQIKQSALTHRLHRYNDPAAGAGNVPIAGNSVEVTDRSGGKNDYRRDRTTFDLRLAARHPKLSNVKWLANAWQEAETGSQQFLFLERCASCHHIQTSQPIDRKTTITQVGFQLDLKSAALRYIRENRDFGNRAPEQFNDFPGVSSVFSGEAPLFGVAATKSDINDIRASGQVGRTVTAAGLWRTDERDDHLGGGQLDVHSAGGGLGWTVSRDLRVGLSYIGRSLDVSGVDEGISRDRNTTRVDVRYAGLQGSTVSVGYAKEKVSRSERDYVPGESDSNIWRASLISRLTPKTRLQLQYRNTSTDFSNDFFDPDAPPTFFPSRLIGLPNDGSSFSGVLSHSLSPRTLVSALYSRRDDKYDVTVPDLAIAHSDEQETRTTGLQLVHNPGQRARVSASYYRQKGDNRTNATYGQADYLLEPPTVPTELVFPPIESMAAFNYDATIGLVDASYWATPKVRLFGRYSSTKTDGQETAYDLGDYLDQDPNLEGTNVEFHPFDIDIVDHWIGVGYLLTPTTEVALSHQRRSWDNSADATQDGSYTVWRLGVRSQF
jgi:DmsE family decaheme c-type cytochrome